MLVAVAWQSRRRCRRRPPGGQWHCRHWTPPPRMKVRLLLGPRRKTCHANASVNVPSSRTCHANASGNQQAAVLRHRRDSTCRMQKQRVPVSARLQMWTTMLCHLMIEGKKLLTPCPEKSTQTQTLHQHAHRPNKMQAPIMAGHTTLHSPPANPGLRFFASHALPRQQYTRPRHRG